MASGGNINFRQLVDIILREFHPNKVVRTIVKCEQQGRTTVTFQVVFNGTPSLILQFRPAARPFAMVAGDVTLTRLGAMIPSIQLLKAIPEFEMLVYEMNQIPGIPFSIASAAPTIKPYLPSIATGMGNLLGKLCVAGTRSGDHRDSRLVIERHLRLAIESVDPRVAVHRDIYVRFLDEVKAGLLDELPLAISNSDISQTNVMVLYGMVTGLLDWEFVESMPLGFELVNIFWLIGTMNKETGYTMRDNAKAISRAFWTAFFAAVPVSLRKHRAALQSAMRISGAIRHCYMGKVTTWHVPFMMMANFVIPQDGW